MSEDREEFHHPEMLARLISIWITKAIQTGVQDKLDSRGKQLQRIIDMLVKAEMMGPDGDPSIEVAQLLRSWEKRRAK